MAQQDVKTIPKKERPSSIKLHTSFSQPNPSYEIKLNSHRYQTLPESSHKSNIYLQSPAERYVAYRSQALFNGNTQNDHSPETPTSIASHITYSFQANMSHAERMQRWHEKKTNEIYKKQKFRYVYGTHSSSSSSSSTKSSMKINIPFLPLTQSIQKSSTQPLTQIAKTDRQNSNEHHSKTKTSSPI